ncbi:hypothetical protein AKJ59_00670 [candidate division MSBL1 archaeon SCGC-AAA385M02]|uniref:Uncharacterized protein n=1 Tax=candidate division MSBL1 archaeon SCGC-AAA385M02 TaxID=1698287 RepID=A0A133VQH1_9EURY|nr:hypothetical protein AKJ59_00670 [candidate division MSBL1 archaeon SCGC-AAA385M02]
MSDKERPKHPPKHCPNCGSENINYIECFTNFRGNIAWDTYCKDCEWSGDISPDSDLDYYRVEAQETFEEIQKAEEEQTHG